MYPLYEKIDKIGESLLWCQNVDISNAKSGLDFGELQNFRFKNARKYILMDHFIEIRRVLWQKQTINYVLQEKHFEWFSKFKFNSREALPPSCLRTAQPPAIFTDVPSLIKIFTFSSKLCIGKTRISNKKYFNPVQFLF